MKAMRKDRTRRYRSASELADDIQNYLTGTPLIAGPESTVYRARKFVRKHAGSVATAALVAVLIVLGLVVSTALSFRAENARKQEATARTQAEQAEKVAEKQRKLAEEQRNLAEEQRNLAQEQRRLAEERAEDYRRSLYFHSIALTDVAYRNKDITHACELLESCPEDLRGWEWYRLNHISDKALMTILDNGVEIGVAVSPDGKYIASAGGSIKVWNAATGAELMTLRGKNYPVGPYYYVSFSPDGKRIVSADWTDKTLKIFEWATGTELRTLQVQHEGPRFSKVGGRFSPDGKYIASWGWDNKVKVWDAETGEELAALRGGKSVRGVSPVAFSPDSKRIVSGNTDKIVRVWDWTTSDEPMILRGHNRIVFAVAFSPDGKRILSGSYDHTIKIWDAENGTEVMTIDTESYVRTMAVSTDGKRIVSVTSDKIKVWDAATGDELMILGGHVGGVTEAVFSPDGRQVISGGNSDGTVKVWDLTDREHLTLRGKKGLSLAFSPDGKRIVSGGTDKMVKIYDTISGAEIMTLSGHSNTVFSVVFTIDGTRIISSSYDGMIKVWDAVSGAELATFRNPDGKLFSVAPSPDGKRIVSGSWWGKTGTVKLWDLSAEGSVKTLHRTKIMGSSCVAFSPDGKYIVSGDEVGEIKIWDVITGNEMKKKRNQQGAVISCIAFSPDGRRIVVGGSKLKVYNIETGNKGMTLKGHGGWIDDVVFSPDGKRIIAACGSLKIWDASTGAEIFSPNEGKNCVTVAISPDGKTIATTDKENNIILLESTVPAGGYKSRRTVQNARKDVEQLYKKLNSYHSVIDALVTDSTLEGPVRQLALQIANARLWEDTEMAKDADK